MPDVSRVPAPDPADTLQRARTYAEQVNRGTVLSTFNLALFINELADTLDALLAGRRQDKERIERLERALEPFVESFREDYPEAFDDLAHLPAPWSVPVIVPAAQIRDAVAALAGEEDTTP